MDRKKARATTLQSHVINSVGPGSRPVDGLSVGSYGFCNHVGRYLESLWSLDNGRILA